VIAHAVAQRQREIGIRMALGAARGSVVAMITMGGLTLAGVGMLLGLPLVFVMYRMAASALGVFEGDVGLAYAGGVALALAAVATLATWLPARRASGIHPSEALRDG
jgi:ABC-type antimicrobial peptide transport system permease subunit